MIAPLFPGQVLGRPDHILRDAPPPELFPHGDVAHEGCGVGAGLSPEGVFGDPVYLDAAAAHDGVL
eukprot:CAMPEP_0202466540 /NCGR_PEP_ID=MMETSP1360-20130828/69100_1 /ASSEMBLY_ACC=CAM_ASM_000848 /TAXON_ID=515479 /ORGANISM="Licmophora paradoxa, Strain CCMP2313" /LENGTH=65 /DNA_ID=CAMNT_0049090711 /DNA_START=63 /DNA_END=260 /DNA_ORIENTATION=+